MKRLPAVQFAFALLLSTLLAAPADVFAQQHVVSSEKLHQDVAATAAAREQHRQTLEKFFGSEKAKQALESAHVDYKQVQNAVNKLSDDDLARLSQRAQNAQNDFAAGNINDHDLLLILVAVAVLVLIIVAVHH